MSVISSIFRRGNLKLFFALAIPIGIAWTFIYSQHEADVEVAKYKEEQKRDPNTDRVVVNNYTLKEINDNNQIRWQLLAKQGVVQPSGHEVELNDVVVDYYDGAKLKMHLSAPIGEVIEETKYVKLASNSDTKVMAIGEDGKAQLSAKKIELKEKNKFLANDDVTIEWPGMAKVTGDSATGAINVSDLKNFKIMGNTHALIGMR